MSKGGGSPSQSTQYTSNIPEYAKPYVMNMLGAAQNELFQTDSSGNITGMKGYKPFSTNPQDYFAGPSSLTTGVYNEAAGMQTPTQFGQATGLAGQAGQGGLDSVGRAYGYGQQGFESGRMGQGLGITGGGYYGGAGQNTTSGASSGGGNYNTGTNTSSANGNSGSVGSSSPVSGGGVPNTQFTTWSGTGGAGGSSASNGSNGLVIIRW